MEILHPRFYGDLAEKKIDKELAAFTGDQKAQAVKKFVASTLQNFCKQDERFAQVVYETPATLSDCCAAVLKGCGTHISDIDVYRGAVKYYFPNAEVVFKLTIDASGTAPTAEEMAKPAPKKEKNAGNSAQPSSATTSKPQKAKKPGKPAPTRQDKKEAGSATQAPQIKQVEKPKAKPKKKDQDDGLIQLTLF